MIHWETIWQFKTARFQVVFEVADEPDLDLSFDNDGSTREGLESGSLVAFEARVRVLLDGREFGADYLGGCIYRDVEEFYTSHRDADPMNRNCSIMRNKKGNNVSICHYFPDMVCSAVAEARKALRNVPHIREALS